MRAVTQLPRQTLEDALARYDLGELQQFWPAANGIENSNYFVRARQQGKVCEYVLTIMEQAANAGAAYVPMMDTLAGAGLPVAPPLRNRNGAAVEEVASKPAMLQRRLPGRHVDTPTNRQISALGRFIAHMHKTMQGNLSAGALALPAYPRDATWIHERAAMVRSYLPAADQSLVNDSVSTVSALLLRHDVSQLPCGMIHGDLFRDNILCDEQGLTGVLDFHHAASGFYIYDLAVAANDWCYDAGRGLDPARTISLLRAYHQVRPLTPQELRFFSSFALYGALTFWLSRLAVALKHKPTDPVRVKDPDEFRRIVQHHHQHQFHVDPGQLAA